MTYLHYAQHVQIKNMKHETNLSLVKLHGIFYIIGFVIDILPETISSQTLYRYCSLFKCY